MCGRYVAVADRSVIAHEYSATPVGDEVLAPDYNVAPTKSVYAVMDRHDERQVRTVKWGLIPSWAKDAKIGSRLINARLETASQKPSFRRAWAKRRALLPADGYYEWYSPPEASLTSAGKPRKQPYYIHPRDGGLMSMAGLYEIWRDPSISSDEDPAAFRWTCTILTMSATDQLGRIHDRMPLLVPASNVEQWLSPEIADPAPDLLLQAAPDSLVAYPVSTAVNRVANNSPDLIEPLAAEPGDLFLMPT
ncbi:MAG: SOS response-associated peptidase [Actinobacteria bacterium]|nr:SOS response-associated peptidase [Actinomycetota bacterium]